MRSLAVCFLTMWHPGPLTMVSDRLLRLTGMHYIEGGWPGSNPKDVEYFDRARKELPSEAWAKVVAFGRCVVSCLLSRCRTACYEPFAQVTLRKRPTDRTTFFDVCFERAAPLNPSYSRIGSRWCTAGKRHAPRLRIFMFEAQ